MDDIKKIFVEAAGDSSDDSDDDFTQSSCSMTKAVGNLIKLGSDLYMFEKIPRNFLFLWVLSKIGGNNFWFRFQTTQICIGEIFADVED